MTCVKKYLQPAIKNRPDQFRTTEKSVRISKQMSRNAGTKEATATLRRVFHTALMKLNNKKNIAGSATCARLMVPPPHLAMCETSLKSDTLMRAK